MRGCRGTLKAAALRKSAAIHFGLSRSCLFRFALYGKRNSPVEWASYSLRMTLSFLPSPVQPHKSREVWNVWSSFGSTVLTPAVSWILLHLASQGGALDTATKTSLLVYPVVVAFIQKFHTQSSTAYSRAKTVRTIIAILALRALCSSR